MQRPTNTVTGTAPAPPAHTARPAWRRGAPLAAVAAAVLVAIGFWIATREPAGGPTPSTPSSALHMKDAGSPPSHR